MTTDLTARTADFGSRSGSAVSVLLTIVGLYLRRAGGWMATAHLVELGNAAGSPEAPTRTAIARLKKRGVLAASTRSNTAGYMLEPGAEHMLRMGDRRIFAPRNMVLGEPWCLVSFSVPEGQRTVRHQLRRRLNWIGCGLVAPALWICPGFLSSEVEEILTDLGIRRFAILFRTELPNVSGPIEDAIAQWWDLPELALLHRRFIDSVTAFPSTASPTLPESFRRYVLGIDAWREIPYLDPGLPLELLPGDWPARESAQLFSTITDQFADDAWRYVETVTSGPAAD